MTRRLAWCLLALLTACGGGGGSSGGGEPPAENPTYSLSGRAQKGPFAIGSQISADELNANLTSTGKSYKTQTSDSLGNFSFSPPLGTKLVSIQANGYYVDEITGRLSTSVINLQATVDLSVMPTPTVNVLTSLQSTRLKTLMTQGASYSTAYSQSQNEVLTAFGVDASKVTGLTTLDAMRIDGSKDADAVLLAVSATLGQMATDASKANGTNQAAELSNLVNTIASQIGSGGTITAPALVAARKLAQTEINLSSVRSNLETYYASQSVTLVAPKFEEWVDASGSGRLPQRRAPVTGLVFADVTGTEPASVVTSNAITVAGLGAGVSAAVAVDADTSLIKNNTVLDGKRTIVQDGDTLALRVTALGYGLTRTSTLSVGASSGNWRVASKALGGTISGLQGSGLVLQLNTAETIAPASGSGSFSFASGVAVGAPFSVTIQTLPSNPAQICGVTNGSGTVGAASAAISVNCYAAGGAFIEKVSNTQDPVQQHLQVSDAAIPTVKVTDMLNQPVVGALVTFKASTGYYATPVTVESGVGGIARLYQPDGTNGPIELYFHFAGAQYMTATLANGASVQFDYTVTPSVHTYDGEYRCTVLPSGYFKVANGLLLAPSVFYGLTLNEGNGQFTLTNGANYEANYYGQIAIDSAGLATSTGTYTASTFAGQSTDPIGNWSCNRL